MTRLDWNAQPREYESGLDRAVFYPQNAPGEVWNGLIGISDDSDDSDVRIRYVDGVRTVQRRRPGSFSGSIEAVTYPNSLHNDIFGQNLRSTFGLSYRVMGPNSYKIHLVYNVLLSPSRFMHQQVEVNSYTWGFTTIPVSVPDAKPSSHLVIDSSIAYSSTISDLEDILYGTDDIDPHLPTPDDVFEVFEENAILRIIDNGDGTWTAIGPDSVITMLDADTFQIDWPSANYIDADTYTIYSL